MAEYATKVKDSGYGMEERRVILHSSITKLYHMTEAAVAKGGLSANRMLQELAARHSLKQLRNKMWFA